MPSSLSSSSSEGSVVDGARRVRFRDGAVVDGVDCRVEGWLCPFPGSVWAWVWGDDVWAMAVAPPPIPTTAKAPTTARDRAAGCFGRRPADA